MANAEFKINKPSLLIEACRAIESLDISGQNQDVQGDLYEYLLSKLNTAERRFITQEKYEQLKRYTVFPGDVLISSLRFQRDPLRAGHRGHQQ